MAEQVRDLTVRTRTFSYHLSEKLYLFFIFTFLCHCKICVVAIGSLKSFAETNAERTLHLYLHHWTHLVSRAHSEKPPHYSKPLKTVLLGICTTGELTSFYHKTPFFPQGYLRKLKTVSEVANRERSRPFKKSAVHLLKRRTRRQTFSPGFCLTDWCLVRLRMHSLCQ